MATVITIQDILGVEPYNVFLCDDTQSLCIYVAQINNADIPYQFEAPLLLQSYTTFTVKIVDSRPCEFLSSVIS